MKSPRHPDTTNPASTKENRLHLERLVSAGAPTPAEINAGSDAVSGLTQNPKSLPPKYFYDDRGSKLFELICQLPEYYLTRTETGILEGCAGAIAHLTGPCEIVELGSGSSTKTRILLDAYSKLEYPLHYLPIDISPTILESSACQLLADYPSLQIHGLVSTYELALAKIAPSPLPTRMICFLGSTLGNLNAQECDLFFSQIVGALQPGEYFLLGIDLDKSKDILEPAYDDSQGVTAAFNLNMLRHLNRRYEGNFDLAQFEHWAFYNQDKCQIEMHLKSKKAQTVQLRTLDLTVEFAAGETIRSEISRKFNLNTVQQELSQRGLKPVQVWTDPNQWFGLMLCQMSDVIQRIPGF
jgi:dimethylhistidine N-methyltransferase